MAEDGSPVFRTPPDGHRVHVSTRASVRSPARPYWFIYSAVQKRWHIEAWTKPTSGTADTRAIHMCPPTESPCQLHGRRKPG